MTHYLLDTHTFLWTLFESTRLSVQVRSILSDCENTVYVSSVTFWEISLKFHLGKLELETYTPERLLHLAKELDFLILPINQKKRLISIAYQK